MPQAGDLAWAGPAGCRPAAEADGALDPAQDAEQRQHQLALALAVEPAQPDDLALADLEVRSASRSPQPRPRTSRHGAGAAWRRRLGRVDLGDVAADHQPRRSPVGREPVREGLDVAAIAEHRAGVRQCGDLVHPMRDVEQCQPFAAQPCSSSNTRSTSAAVSAEVASSRISSCGRSASALAISTSCRRDSGRSFTRARGSRSSQPSRARYSARRRWARRSIRPKRRGGSARQTLSATLRSGTSESSWKIADDAGPVGGTGPGEPDSTGRPAGSRPRPAAPRRK